MKKIKGHIAVLIIVTMLLGGGAILLGNFLGDIDYKADAELFIAARSSNTTEYYAYEGNNEIEVYRSGNGAFKEWIPIALMGENIKKAFLSAEDREFYSHGGVNIRRTVQAAVKNLVSNGRGYGASTITQQVIKNISGDNERSFKRKLCEIFRAIHLEREFSKEEILEIYLNIIPMSGNVIGVSEAAERYFGKEVSELSIAECATLAAVTNSPAKYCPIKHPDSSMRKRNIVLYAMLDNGVISKNEYDMAISEPINTIRKTVRQNESSWFIETANEDILKDIMTYYNISRGAARMMLRGARVYLTEDVRVQSALEEVFYNRDNFADIELLPNYSMVVIDNRTGSLAGIIGGAGNKEASEILNYADVKITPASTIKPLSIYAPLIEDGQITMATLVEDAPITYKFVDGAEIGYPKNSPNFYSGFITVSDAVRLSKNTTAMRLLMEMGEKVAFDRIVKDYNFSLVKERKTDGKVLSDIGLSPLSLGQLTDGLTLRELTRAYTVFPRDGVISNCRSYYAVFSFDGKLIIEQSNRDRRIYKTTTARIMTALLEGVVEDGTASSIRLKYIVDAAGKTGTSSLEQDRLFIGFSPYYTAGIWCGYSDGKTSVPRLNPSHITIWDDVMIRIHRSIISSQDAISSFDKGNIVRIKYCPICGGRVDDDANNYSIGYFVSENDLLDKCVCKRDEEFTECSDKPFTN